MGFWEVAGTVVVIAWAIPIILVMAVLLYRAATWHLR